MMWLKNKKTLMVTQLLWDKTSKWVNDKLMTIITMRSLAQLKNGFEQVLINAKKISAQLKNGLK